LAGKPPDDEVVPFSINNAQNPPTFSEVRAQRDTTGCRILKQRIFNQIRQGLFETGPSQGWHRGSDQQDITRVEYNGDLFDTLQSPQNASFRSNTGVAPNGQGGRIRQAVRRHCGRRGGAGWQPDNDPDRGALPLKKGS
jgi:hypothetical protein